MFGKIGKAINRYQSARRTAEELGRLTDRELSDLGISRSEIWNIARYGNAARAI